MFSDRKTLPSTSTGMIASMTSVRSQLPDKKEISNAATVVKTAALGPLQ